MSQRILVLGAGITGCYAVRTLRRLLGHQVDIEVWEQARGTGGRLSTTWGQAGNTKADMGAQYLSLDITCPEAKGLYDDLIGAGVLREADAECVVATPERPQGPHWRHCYAVAGTSSVLKHLLAESGATLRTEHCVNSITPGSHGWHVGSKHGAGDVRLRGGSGRGAGVRDEFDAVLLCNGPGRLGGADALDNITGGWHEVLESKSWAALKSVRYGRRYVIAFFLHSDCYEKCDQFFGSRTEVLIDDDLIHLVAYQSRKVGAAGDGEPIAVVCHTIPEVAQPPKDKCVRAVQQWLMRKLGVQKPAEKIVLGFKIQTWGKCQVEKSAASILKGALCLSSVEGSSPLAVCGDYFSGPTVTDALRSASAGATEVVKALRHSPAGDVDTGRTQVRPRQNETPSKGHPAAASPCQECGCTESHTFRDKNDGKNYCRSCWMSYYGRAPPKASEVTRGGDDKVHKKKRKCGECQAMNDKLFLDRKDGVEYCQSCWFAYYGQAPPDSVQGG